MLRTKKVKFKMPNATATAESPIVRDVYVVFYLLPRADEQNFVGYLKSDDGSQYLQTGPYSRDDFGGPGAQVYMAFSGVDPTKTYSGAIVTSDQEIDTETAFASA